MCLFLVALQQHLRFELVMASNRDEFFDRPTHQARFWNDAPSILAGRDLRAGGTWLGVTRRGRLATVTNVRNQAQQKLAVTSRGILTTRFLQEEVEPKAYLNDLQADLAEFHDFNLVVGERSELYYYSSVHREIRQLPTGISGLSNSDLASPWPKVTRGKTLLAELLRHVHEDALPHAILQLLQDRVFPADALLPKTGIELEVEWKLSPIFVKAGRYGTRSSTVILMTYAGEISFFECSYGSPCTSPSIVEYHFMCDG